MAFWYGVEHLHGERPPHHRAFAFKLIREAAEEQDERALAFLATHDEDDQTPPL